jgi:hypothetical protein
MWPLLALQYGTLDETGVLYNNKQVGYPTMYHPTTIAQCALAHWNAYIATEDQKHREAFMIQANWLVAHETRFADDRGGWPMPFLLPRFNALKPCWLSALAQGNCISVLVRAYHLTDTDVFLHVARRAIRTFELDIKEGAISTSVGGNGIFFDEFDAVYWSYYDLRFKVLAPRFYHALHITLLQALARYSGCEHCTAIAERWERYQQSFLCRMRYLMTVLATHAFRVLST